MGGCEAGGARVSRMCAVAMSEAPEGVGGKGGFGGEGAAALRRRLGVEGAAAVGAEGMVEFLVV